MSTGRFVGVTLPSTLYLAHKGSVKRFVNFHKLHSSYCAQQSVAQNTLSFASCVLVAEDAKNKNNPS